ncbi:hypothetical protein DICPUDRAFT_97312 [Dictyostelium purpureum]|uniref:Interferon-related developmental regulator N-terminal domain-containing protein n=1 Tax=Dictyostelium purpureum TaxID=5786 RepID=F0ZFL9_DICPU|nr:uncharacterized protein DICPUDRAFT_97312 [Dictyostelium purpureum]EGC37253.1 hypothetical protein DICPUDRAFT_97312 [Dictyostelium purpureum]|eukprot:XP_003286223.1 hypothetical protein DICPUDRAFT_97312 [Dictyostelium purpureum]
MNIRTRKSNHRAVVAVHKALNEKHQPFEYFIPLLKEKKASIITNAVYNLNTILTLQGNRGEEIPLELVEALCSLFSSHQGRLEKPIEIGKCISLCCLNSGENMEMYRIIKGSLTSIISDGEQHVKDNELIGCIVALSNACFYSCSDRDSYKHTIEIFQDLLYTQKRKNILDKILNAWLLLLTKINPKEMEDYKLVLSRLIEFSKSSSQNLRVTSSIAIALIVDDVKEKVLDDFESEIDSSRADDDEDYSYEYEEEDEDEYEDEDEDYREEEEEIQREYRSGKGKTYNIENLSLEGGNASHSGEDYEDSDEYDEDGYSNSAVSEEDQINQIIIDDDHMIQVIENTLRMNEEKGKKKIQSKSLLRQVLTNLKDGEPPKETIVISGLPFHFTGWRKYIQLDALRKLVGPGMSSQWEINENLQELFDFEIPRGQELNDLLRVQKRNQQKSKKKDFDRDSKNSALFYNNAAN